MSPLAGQSYDNALAETTNGLYEAECVYRPDASGWDDVEHLELATPSWVHWFNEQRLHGTPTACRPRSWRLPSMTLPRKTCAGCEIVRRQARWRVGVAWRNLITPDSGNSP